MTPRTESGARELRIDPGPPPVPPSDGPQAPDDAPVSEKVLDQAVEWETEAVGDLLLIPFFPIWAIASRSGAPPGAFLPDRSQRDRMARPLVRILNRSERLRRFARLADPLAFAGAVAQFLQHEASEVSKWRAGQAPVDAPPDSDLPVLGTSALRSPADRETAERRRETVRRWRPPQSEPEGAYE